MTRILFRRVLLFLAACVLLYSCRIEDDLIAEKNGENKARKFRALTSKDGEPVNYSRGFKYLLERYDKLHGTEFTKKTVMKNNKFAKNSMPEFIEFNIHSQDLIRNNGTERWIMYPVIKNNEVSGIAIAILKEEETNLQFWRLDEKDPYYKEVIGLFRMQYNKGIMKQGLNNRKPCGTEGEEPCEIPEVIITVPGNGPGNDPWMYKPTLGQGGGYCQTYGNCYGDGGNDDGGGGSGGGESTPTEPNINQNIIDELKDYPCAQNLVKELPTLKNDLATSMQKIFQNNTKYNITFKPKSGLGDVDGTTFMTTSPEFGTFNAIININDQILANATKEYILATMYHEVIHAFLGYELFRLGSTAFHEQYLGVVVGYEYGSDGNIINRFTFLPGHQQFGSFLATLENILSSYNPDLPLSTVKAIAKAGITTTTPEESQLNNNERNTSLGNHKGTTCP